MTLTVWAVVREGKIEPLEQIDLPEGSRVLITLVEDDESSFWLQASQVSLDAVWGNPEDDVYAHRSTLTFVRHEEQPLERKENLAVLLHRILPPAGIQHLLLKRPLLFCVGQPLQVGPQPRAGVPIDEPLVAGQDMEIGGLPKGYARR